MDDAHFSSALDMHGTMTLWTESRDIRFHPHHRSAVWTVDVDKLDLHLQYRILVNTLLHHEVPCRQHAFNVGALQLSYLNSDFLQPRRPMIVGIRTRRSVQLFRDCDLIQGTSSLVVQRR